MDFQFKSAVDEAQQEQLDKTVDFSLNVDDTLVNDSGEPILDADGEEQYRYEQDDHRYLLHFPSPAMLAIAASDSMSGSDVERVSMLWDYFRNTLDDEDFVHLRQRILSRNSGLGVEHLDQVMKGTMEEFTAFPTRPSSASSASPKRTGGSSTGRQPGPGSTRSRSVRAVS